MKIPVCKPVLGKTEQDYVLDAIKKEEISGNFGGYINNFENQFAKFCDCSFGISTNSGTTALHLAVASLGIKKGDEILVSTFTNMATFFAVIYQDAKPIPIDIDPDTLNMNPDKIEEKITSKTKGIIVVHLFGHPTDMNPILEIAKRHKLYVIEDCAEAHGALYKGRKVGSIGDIGCFSFYANKIITTGEGGMLTTNNLQIDNKSRLLRGLAFGNDNKFQHQDVGFSYRMTNLQAAIGCAQMHRIENIIERKRKIANYYNNALKKINGLRLPLEKNYAKNVYWMYHIIIENKLGISREIFMQKLSAEGIETRETFVPFNQQHIFQNRRWTQEKECPVANHFSDKGLYLPTGPMMKKQELDYVIKKIKNTLK